MLFGIRCPKCGKVALKLRPGYRPKDLDSTVLSMSYFVGKVPLDPVQCDHCNTPFDETTFNVENLRPLTN